MSNDYYQSNIGGCFKYNFSICLQTINCAWCIYDDVAKCIDYDPCETFRHYCFNGKLNHSGTSDCHTVRDIFILSLMSFFLIVIACLAGWIVLLKCNGKESEIDVINNNLFDMINESERENDKQNMQPYLKGMFGIQ